MWHEMIVTCGWGVFGLVLYGWVRWTDLERKLLGNGTARFLE